MSYIAPKVNEMLYAKRDGVGVYKSPSTTSEKLLTNSEHDDHSLRDFRAGDPIGKVLVDEVFPSPDGNQFLKIEYWTWERDGDNIFGFKLFGKGNKQIFHEGYINVADEPEQWIRDTWRDIDLTRTEQKDKQAEITTALKNYPGVPAPSSIEKKKDADGNDYWLLSWTNGYAAIFEDFQKLPAADKVTLTTRDPGNPNSLVDPKKTTDKESKSSVSNTVFTTTNMLIGVAVLGLFAVLITLLLKKK